MQPFLFALAFSAALSILGFGSAGASVVFDMTGSCTYFCGSSGQNSGDPISGFVAFDDSFDTAANGSYLIPVDYHLEFGNVIMDPSDESQTFLRSGYDTFQKLDPNEIGPGSFMVWSSTQNLPLIFIGNCCGGNPQSGQWTFGFAPGSFGPFAFTRENPLVAEAPEPGTGAIFAAALALGGFAFARRRRAD
jgi:hypothetical protein